MNTLLIHIKQLVKIEYIILSLIIILGFVVRLYKIDSPVADWHSWRQADTAAVSRNYLKEGIDLINPKFDDISSIQSGIDNPNGIRMVEFPIYNLLHVTIYNYLAEFSSLSFESWGRITTALISLISAVFVFLIARRYYGVSVGLIASAIFTFLPFNIYFSRVILPDPLGVMFGLIGLYLYAKNLVFSAVFFSLAILQKPYLGFFLFPLIPEFLKVEKIRKHMLFFAIIGLPFLLWRYRTNLNPEGIPFYKWAFNGDLIRFHPAWFRWIFGERIGILILGVGGVAAYTLGLINDKKKFSWLFNLGALFYLTAVATANVRHDYYQILIIPALSIAVAIGFVTLFKKNKVVTFIALITMILIGWDKVKPFYQINHPELISIGKIVDQSLPPNAKIVAPYNGDTAFLYQLNRKGWPAVDDSIEGLIERGATHYISLDKSSPDSLNFSLKFEKVMETDNFILLDLGKEVK